MPLNASFVADFTSFLEATQKAIDATERFEKAAGLVGPAYDIAAKQAAAANEEQAAAQNKLLDNAYKIGRQVGDSLKDIASKTIEFASVYVEAFAEAERGTARLTQALKDAGETDATAKVYADIAAELSKISTFSTGALTNVETLFTTVGGIKPDQMREALEATMNLAAGMAGSGMSLEQAAKLVATAVGSQGEKLTGLKRILGDTIEKGATFEEIMKAINDKFGGQAAADLKTYAGQMEHLKNQIGDLNEKIGAVLVPALTKLLELFQSLPDGVQEMIIGIVAIGTALAPVLVSIASLINILGSAGLGGALGGAISAIGSFLLYAGEAVVAIVGWPALIVAALAAAVVLIVKYWDEIVAGIKWAWEKIKEIFSKIGEATTAVVDWFKRMYEGIKLWIADKFAALVDFVGSIVGKLVDWFLWAYNTIIGHSIVPDLISGIASEFRKLDRVMVDPTLDAVAAVSAGLDSIGAPELGGSTLSAGALAAASRAGAGGTVVNITMSGMMGTDDPQTRAALRDVISSALMSGMRGTRLMGTT
jgi:hypothetical protein